MRKKHLVKVYCIFELENDMPYSKEYYIRIPHELGETCAAYFKLRGMLPQDIEEELFQLYIFRELGVKFEDVNYVYDLTLGELLYENVGMV